MNKSISPKKTNKWYVILLALVGIIFALPPGTLLGLALSVASFVVARATRSSEQVPLVAILISGLTTIVAFFFPL